MQGARKLTKRPKDNDKAQRDFFLNRTEKQAGKVRITEKALDRLDVVEKPWESWDLHLEIAAAPRSGAVVARLDDAVVRRGDFTLGPIDVEIGWAERVAILGPNGSGKTTLLGALLGRIPLDVRRRSGSAPGSSSARSTRRAASCPVTSRRLDAFVRASGLARQQDARSLLAKFGLAAEHVDATGGVAVAW